MGCASDYECDLCSRGSSFFPPSPPAAGGAAAAALWIDPRDVRHLYRIGRGQFGDVWYARARFASGERAVAAKVLPLVGQETIDTLLRRIDAAAFACQGLKAVNAPVAVSIANGRVCVLSTLYEGSVGGRLAHLADSRLSLPETIKYAIDIAKAVMELHSRGLLSLNLKPCNFLLDSNNDALIGDQTLPLLLSGCKSVLDLKLYMGTPNYMAPEQWSVDTRGPLALETDSWGFACSVLEMVTGKRPWEGKAPQEISDLVLLKCARPDVPIELPAAIRRVLEDCFEYDYRNRPDFNQILAAFTSPVLKRGDWVHVYDEPSNETKIGMVIDQNDAAVQVRLSKKEVQSHSQVSRKLGLWKNPLRAGDHVTVKKSARRGCWRYTPHNAEGVVIEVDRDEILIRVRFCSSSQELWEGTPDELELVSFGITAGDWVHRLADIDRDRHSSSSSSSSCVGIVHGIQRDGEVQVAFVGCNTLWSGVPTGLAKIQPLQIGQRVKPSCCAPRFDWPSKERTGRITGILPNGCLLLSSSWKLKNKEQWYGDPAQVQLVESGGGSKLFSDGDLLSSLQWTLIHPVVFALGVLAGLLLGNTILQSNAAAAVAAAAAAAAAGGGDDASSSDWKEGVLVTYRDGHGSSVPEQSSLEPSSPSPSSSSCWLVRTFNRFVSHLAESSDAFLQ